MAKNILLFCEGRPGGLDQAVMHLLKRGLTRNRCEVVPMGSKNGRGRFAEGYWETAKELFDGYIVFRDRDFDIKPTGDNGLIVIKDNTDNQSKEFAGARTTIENYFLDVNHLVQFITSFRPAKSMNLSQMQDMLRDVSVELRYYQAARHAIGRMISDTNEDKPRKGTPFLDSTWSSGSGHLPERFDMDACLYNGKAHLESYQKRAGHFSVEKYEQHYEEYSNLFDEAFCSDLENVLQWFNGKDVTTALQARLGNDIPFKGKKSYYEYVISNEQFGLSNFPDLLELQKTIDEF